MLRTCHKTPTPEDHLMLMVMWTLKANRTASVKDLPSQI